MKTSFILAAGLALFSVAHAQSAVSVIVKFADLDLNTEWGDSTLYHRLTAAASKACWQYPVAAEPLPISREKELERMHARCVQRAIDGAVARINQPVFIRYVASQQTNASYGDLARQ